MPELRITQIRAKCLCGARYTAQPPQTKPQYAIALLRRVRRRGISEKTNRLYRVKKLRSVEDNRESGNLPRRELGFKCAEGAWQRLTDVITYTRETVSQPLPRIFYISTEVIILCGKMLIIPLFTILFTLLTVPPPHNMQSHC